MMMRRFIPVLLAFLVPAGAHAVKGETTGRGSGPVIDIPLPDHDFGRVYREEKSRHAFTVFNRGTSDLIIEDVKPSCGCTAAKFDRLIPPGQQGNVELEIDGSQVHGDFRKTAAVKSNDQYHPSFTITVSGNAIPYVNVVPEGTVTMHGRFGERAEQTLTITSNETDLDFKVLGVRSNIDDKITYVLEDGSAPGEYRLALYKNPKLPTLSTYGTIYLATNSPKVPEAAVQVHVLTKGSIVITPSVLNYGAVKFGDGTGGGAPAMKTITVTRASGEFKIKDVTVSNPNYRAVVDAVTPGQQYRVQVAFTPPARKPGAKQTESGEMIIHTDDPREPAVRVQLIARAQ